mmetsp:Transcript_20815/g.51053  ORF Transcript_20815/g.51053 Transcript_20815/m.51053 type:complete len:339 (+) Transcript_20815:87-1103(+)
MLASTPSAAAVQVLHHSDRAQLAKSFGEDLVSDMEFVDGLLERVPATYYYPKEIEALRQNQQGKRGKRGKGSKRRKDPFAPMTVLEVAHATWSGARQPVKGGDKRTVKNRKTPKAKANISELRERLRSKIESLRKPKRKTGSEKGDPKKVKKQKVERGGAKEKNKSTKKKKTKAQKEPSEVKDDYVSLSSQERAALAVGSGEFMFGGLKTQKKAVANPKKKQKKISDEAHLKKIQRFEKKLEKVDKATRAEILHEKRIQDALSRAQGVAVKDDKKLLRKSIARKKAQKQKSKKAWASRKKQANEELEERLNKRDDNIKDYQQKKKERRVAKLQAKRKR